MPKRIAVKLTALGERYVRQGHPWIFSDAIIKCTTDAQTGDVAVIFGKNKNKMIGLGLYDADSPIRIKMLYHGSIKVAIDGAFFRNRIEKAYQLRIPLFQTKTNSYRLLFGENDGFPGLIVDVYNNVAVIKMYSGIWIPYLDDIKRYISNIVVTDAIVLRLSRHLQSISNQLKDGEVIYGELIEEEVDFMEYGIHFSANVIKGHKTGFFLDHRENRRLVGKLSQGKTVLDVFSYAGGFSVHALVNGAREVTSVDISDKALQVATKNAARNDFQGVHKIICGDAFEELNNLIKSGKKFDVVVIDPPSFAKRKSEIPRAKVKYKQLAEIGARLTSNKGILVLASCSSRISSQSFYDINNQILNNIGRSFEIIMKTDHDIDHPVTFPEASYLKTGYYRFNDL